MKTLAYILPILVAATSAPAAPTAPKNADEKIPTCADVVKVVRAMPEFTKRQVLYFELFLWDKSVGYMVYELTPNHDKAGGYTLKFESLMQLPKSSRIQARLTAKLSADFEPSDVDMVRNTVAPDGMHQQTANHALIGNDVVSLDQQVDDAPITGNTVPLPERPYIMGAEFIVSHLDPKRFPKFELRTFNPQDGTVDVERYKSEKHDDGSYKFWATGEGGVILVEYDRDATGRINAIKKEGVPIEFRASSAKRIERLRITMAEPPMRLNMPKP